MIALLRKQMDTSCKLQDKLPRYCNFKFTLQGKQLLVCVQHILGTHPGNGPSHFPGSNATLSGSNFRVKQLQYYSVFQTCINF